MRRRRRYRWAAIAAMARGTPGVWRLHRDLIAVDRHTLRHARRRVPALQPTPQGSFELRRGHTGRDDTGRLVFDLLIRWTPSTKETDDSD